MHRCITKQLARLSYQCPPTSAPQRMASNPGFARAIWSSTRPRTLHRPNVVFSTRLRSLFTRPDSVMARRLRLTAVSSGGGAGSGSGGRWRVLCSRLLPGRVSDRNVERCGLALAASWFTLLTVQSECDQVDFDLLVKNKILNPDEEQTGWDRLAAMYTLDEMGGLTPELELVRDIATAGLLIGGSLGAMLNGRLAIVKFVERNQATAFESQIVAKRALQDRVTLGMARGFFMFGWRTALFTSAFTLVSTTLMVYTNQISALHYACGGVAAGALYKANMGLRGMTAGAVAGGMLGLIGGGIFSLTCYLTDTTLPKLRYQQYLWKHQQELRAQARAERKREKRRLEAEKKLEEKKEELAHTELQEAVAVAVSNSISSGEAAAEQGSDSSQEATSAELSAGSPEEAAAVRSFDSSQEAVVAQGFGSFKVAEAGDLDRTETRFDFDAAVAAAAAAVSGTGAQSGDTKGAAEVVRAS